ncbi:Alpha/Beta hydrolase protein [Penicillium soppii]|uniref:Alpha/Beta hydrolase protein n=1 Tax=Penicillium soppii TaxID=69789 RepID=UPI0025492ACC|nr:Alpha/Beta hydrolase protein [Penicillium soppii]KAJ5855781.1 Alpha/Beta hydrolase protein [Penicillium soppii]
MATAGIKNRINIQIPTQTPNHLQGWLYPSQISYPSPSPAIILAHGLGGTKELKLDVYADIFNKQGYTCVVFDYRCTGESPGLPRGLIDWNMQQEDWKSAIEYARNLKGVDPDAVALFGTSFSGGHVIQLAAQDGRIRAAIAQCPFTSGVRSSLRVGVRALPGIVWAGLRDWLFSSDERPVMVSLVGGSGDGMFFFFFSEVRLIILAALMNAPDVMSTFHRLIPEGYSFQNEVPARLVLQLPFLRPGSHAAKVHCPILFGICGDDSVAPAGPTLKYANIAPNGVVKWYEDVGHFEIYYDEAFEKAIKDYVEFLRENLSVEAPGRA